MSFKYQQKIPTTEEILQKIPLKEPLKKVKEDRDRQIREIFEGKDERFILVIGPCSADNEDAVCEYVGKLKKLQDKVGDKFLMIPRIYTNKPRTTGVGYKGMAHQPDPTDKPNIVRGLEAIRKMHIRVIEESGLSAADEMLYPENYPYLEDVLSYVAIGARSVENQQHRLTVSGLEIASGMKNPTGGDIGVMLNSVQAAQAPHVFIYNGFEVETSGNPLAHCILRGAFNRYGQNIPNYHYEDIIGLIEMYSKRDLKNPAVLIDTNHANSGKKFNEQCRIAKEVMNSMRYSESVKSVVKGLMIESYLVEGTQSISEGTYGKSITDPCLGWESTEKLIQELAELI